MTASEGLSPGGARVKESAIGADSAGFYSVYGLIRRRSRSLWGICAGSQIFFGRTLMAS